MDILIHTHSGLRWLVLLFMIVTIIRAFQLKSKPHIPGRNTVNLPLYTLILFSIQFILGIVLFFKSPLVSFHGGFMKDGVIRFFAVEHGLMMLIALILIHIGYIRFTKLEYARGQRTVFIYYLIALIVVLAGIPWPFRGFGNNWF